MSEFVVDASGIRWNRVVMLAGATALVVAVVGGLWLWRALHDVTPMPAGGDVEAARQELEGMIGWLRHEGVPATSLADECGGAAVDAIQLFEEPGMSFGSESRMAASLRGDRLSTTRMRFGPDHSRMYPTRSTTLSPQQVRALWQQADRLADGMPPASAYAFAATDSASIGLELCRDGRYASIERYLGTHDPDNKALVDFHDALWSLGTPTPGN